MKTEESEKVGVADQTIFSIRRGPKVLFFFFNRSRTFPLHLNKVKIEETVKRLTMTTKQSPAPTGGTEMPVWHTR